MDVDQYVRRWSMRIVFMGTPGFSQPVLQALIDSPYDVVAVVTQPDRKVGRKQLLMSPPVKELALTYNIPVLQPERIKNDYEAVLSFNPDLIITCAYGQIIPKALLDRPTFGAINVHASLLPKYRGGAPIHKAIIDGEKETGITIMYMVEKMDAGDIITQKKFQIENDDNVATLHDKLSVLGATLLIETLPLLFNRQINALPQDERLVTYAYNIKPTDERLDWFKSNEALYNQIRGLNPWPGAYTLLNNKRVKVYAAQLGASSSASIPGMIIGIDDEGIIVSTGSGTLRILEVQLEGKKRQKIKEVLNGNHPFTTNIKFE